MSSTLDPISSSIGKALNTIRNQKLSPERIREIALIASNAAKESRRRRREEKLALEVNNVGAK